ncbi:MAG: flagellar hook-length control protein FliK, partial [Alphaproteobacteria bacterium]
MTLLAAYIANLAGSAPVEDQKSTLASAMGAGGLFSALVQATGTAQVTEGETAPILTPFELPATPATTQVSAESSALREALTQGLGLPQGGSEIDAAIIESPGTGNATPVNPVFPAAVPDTDVLTQPPENGQSLTPAQQLAPVEPQVPAPAADTLLQKPQITDTVPPVQPIVEVSVKPAETRPVTQQSGVPGQASVNEAPRPTGLENAAVRASGYGKERVQQVALNHAARTNGQQGEPQSTPATSAAKQGDDGQPASRNLDQRSAADIPASVKQGDTRNQIAERGTQIIKAVVKPGSGQTLIRFQKFSSGDPAIATSPPTLTVNVQANAASPGLATANTPHVPVSALAVHIAAQANNGARRFDIRLDPPELGRIEVRLNISRDGQVMTHLVVERAETLDLLQRDARQLERALQDAGLNTSKESMEFSLKDQGLAHGGKEQAEGEEDFASLTESGDKDTPDVSEDPMPPPIRYMATTGL